MNSIRCIWSWLRQSQAVVLDCMILQGLQAVAIVSEKLQCQSHRKKKKTKKNTLSLRTLVRDSLRPQTCLRDCSRHQMPKPRPRFILALSQKSSFKYQVLTCKWYARSPIITNVSLFTAWHTGSSVLNNENSCLVVQLLRLIICNFSIKRITSTFWW